jgi:hypothetical protein
MGRAGLVDHCFCSRAFNIHKSKDDTGSEEEVEAAYSDGVTRCLHTLYSISRQC